MQTDDIATAKDRLRRAAIAKRSALAPQARIEAALAVADLVAALQLPEDSTVSGFWPIREEIDVRPLMAALRERGHRLCLPVVARPRLEFRELRRDGALIPAGFGTMAPGPQAETVEPDVMLVPFAAFDRRGHRIGYGQGHYDRTIEWLAKRHPLQLIGVGFSVQEVETVPAAPHDRMLDVVATETGLIDCAAERSD